MQKSSFKTNDGCQIYYETHGFDLSKPAIVFLNGTMQTTFNWRPHTRFFKDSYSVILYDARAQGKSELGKKELSLDLHIQDLIALFDHLEIEKAHLAGMSHGAYVALAFASKFPEYVDRLVLCSAGINSSGELKNVLRSWLEILKFEGLEALARAILPVAFGEKFLKTNKTDQMIKAITLRNKMASLIAHFEASINYPSPGFFVKNIKCPSLIISAFQDKLVNPKEARELANICRGRHMEIPGVGHSVPVEAPKLFNKLVLEFLTQPQNDRI
ncbi:MAG: alpha/beta fold hydrolase [Desulfobacterales bacterium]|nr:alpha/beta fold hydrolase [Desulfobacterales bacterium]